MPRVDAREPRRAGARRRRSGTPGWKSMLMVCTGTGCVSAKSLPLRDALPPGAASAAACRTRSRSWPPAATASAPHGPICVVQPEGVFYERLKAEAVPRADRVALREGSSRSRSSCYRATAASRPVPLEKDIEFFAKQQLHRAAQPAGRSTPRTSTDAHPRRRLPGAAQGAARGARRRRADPARSIRSGLRGRGGGGFPAGVKWESLPQGRARAQDERPTSSATATRATPARSWTAASSRPTRTR